MIKISVIRVIYLTLESLHAYHSEIAVIRKCQVRLVADKDGWPAVMLGCRHLIGDFRWRYTPGLDDDILRDELSRKGFAGSRCVAEIVAKIVQSSSAYAFVSHPSLSVCLFLDRKGLLCVILHATETRP